MIRIVALTDRGYELGQRIQRFYADSSELWFKPQPFAEKVQQAFREGDRLLFICATGIVVRTLAPVITDKYQDPPVLVMDEAGQFVVPLLSGHEGGANQWGYEVAQHMQAQLVLTTAQTYVDSPVYTVGMGCERDCPKEELMQLLEDCLQKTGLSIDQVVSINSVDIKHDEQGLIECAKALNKPFNTYSKTLLAEVEDQLSEKSEYVFQVLGIYGVAEAAALVAAKELTGSDAELVLKKVKTSKATCAIAVAKK